MKVFFFSFPLLCSHQSRPCTPPLDYHRSFFPIQSIFISPLHSLYSCFWTRSLFGNSCFCVTPLSLFTSSLTSSFSLPPTLCHPSPASFNPTCLIFPSTVSLPDFSRCLSQYALTSSLSNAPSLPPVSAKPSMDQLSSLVGCLCLTLHTWS